MTHAIGTDVYGAVRSVGRTPIVTKFFMVQGLPIRPMESYYFRALGEWSGSGVPFLGEEIHRAIIGIPCDRINRLSVFVAYVRAVCGAIVVLSTIPLFALGICRLCDPVFRFEADKKMTVVIAGMVLASGVLLGLTTYLVNLTVPARERRIRLACARVLGIAADPAHVKLEIARDMIVRADEFLQEQQTPDLDAVLCRTAHFGLPVLDQLLVRTRAEIQNSGASISRESNTDRILQAIDLLGDQRSGGLSN
jgi:hypothetical protein